MTLDKSLFKNIVARFPTGVTVMSCCYNGAHYGLTVNTFASLSLEPPLILFCIDKKAGSWEAFLNCDHFVINFLSAKQENLARHFASKVPDKFLDIDYQLTASGQPLLINVAAFMEARKYAVYEAGDHSIVVGEIIAGQIDSSSEILGYFDRKFVTHSN